MIQQMQHACNECKGTGETINDRGRCLQCKGEKVVQEKKVLEVHVEKGMQDSQKITFPEEADEVPDTMTGDSFSPPAERASKIQEKGASCPTWMTGNSLSNHNQEAYDEDDDMHGGAQRVQCAQQ
ncbi:unnamed protein product [Fraxinus pennsylvanica]|uniref:Uncharacterized protein n=1 Tax=Fraxinus pennsylvanica TaxID=56036 RepID=A0AAD2AI36_9LAMI|nr:unnamed protein product [Fraxinus pennsylvanica]